MAFGFRRLPGPSRRFLNESNPDFAIGAEISYRQYDKYLAATARKAVKGGAKEISRVERELAETKRNLDRLQRDLEKREASVAAREALVAEREKELALEKELFRKGRTDKGQRRFNVALEAYVRSERAKGRTISKREAKSSPAFKQIMSDLKGRPNKRRNPNIAAENDIRRRRALSQLGGADFFRDQYQSVYGRGTSGGPRFRGVNAAGRSISRRR